MLVASTMALHATPAVAGPAATPEPESEVAEASTPDPLLEAQQLYDRGRAAFETADYEGAIGHWTDAYANVPNTPEAGRIKALLIYNIAAARERVFGVTKDPSHLRQAKILLEEFEKSIPELYSGDAVEPETAKVRERIASIQAALDETEQPASKPEEPVVRNDPEQDTGPGGRGLVIGGAVGLSLGIAGLGLMGAGLGMGAGANDLSDLDDDDIEGRREQFNRGRTGNTLAIAGGIVGGVGVIAGTILLAMGLKRRRQTALTTGPGMVGLGLRTRF